MSWSFAAVGKPAAILAKARKDLTTYKCAEPEEAIKTHVLSILENALTPFPPNGVVQVSAGGSQSTHLTDPVTVTNALNLEIKPIFGFVE